MKVNLKEKKSNHTEWFPMCLIMDKAKSYNILSPVLLVSE